MLIAGEPSGDLLAAELVGSIRAEAAAIPQSKLDAPRFFGAGGPQMAAAGVELAFDLTQHSVIGLWEVVRNYATFRRFFNQLLALACERKPGVIVCVDYQGFNSRFARAVRERSRRFAGWRPKLVQYVSPQVWASRPGRAQRLADTVDLLISIVPFEKPWYAERVPRLRVEFVGHPIVGRHGNADATDASNDSAPSTLRHSPSTPRVLLLPGSRVGELKRHIPPMLEAVRIIRRELPAVTFCMVLPGEDLKPLANHAAALGVAMQVGGLGAALREATVAIASTGTVTLECAWFGVPAVALYKTSGLTYMIGRQLVTVDFLAMPNLLAGREVFPEFVQNAATGGNLAHAALDLLRDDSRRASVKEQLAKVVASLGPPGASNRAAKAVLNCVDLSG